MRRRSRLICESGCPNTWCRTASSASPRCRSPRAARPTARRCARCMDNDQDIAVVGMSCRLPGANDLEQFWRNLAAGVESITRLPQAGIQPGTVGAAPVLDNPAGFDAAFFGYSPMEAKTIDPQHRILLELAHEALEHAGCDPARYPGRIGVYAGSALNTYYAHAGLHTRIAEDYIPTLIANDKDFLATRISYKLNLKGPSMTVQTACSTSLVAVHLARQGLLCGEIDMALVGAISVRVPHRAGYLYDGSGVVSPDGRVRAFDAKANGTVFGSRSEEHTSELQSPCNLVCRLLLEKKKTTYCAL